MINPIPLTEGYRANFDTMLKAIKAGDVALVSAIRKADQAPVALVCAVDRNEDGTVTPVPFAVMCEGNPYEDFEDPTQDADDNQQPPQEHV